VKNQTLICLFSLLVVLMSTVSTVHAASQNECAIWICLPGGFPAGCGAAHSAMISRIEDRKPPLPAFTSCAAKEPGHSDMSYDYNYAAFIPAGKKCVRWDYERDGDSDYQVCSQWESWDDHWVKGTRCIHRTSGEDEYWYPEGCTTTARYVDVFVDRQLVGETYYWGYRSASSGRFGF
jgi:hypothetical protein